MDVDGDFENAKTTNNNISNCSLRLMSSSGHSSRSKIGASSSPLWWWDLNLQSSRLTHVFNILLDYMKLTGEQMIKNSPPKHRRMIVELRLIAGEGCCWDLLQDLCQISISLILTNINHKAQPVTSKLFLIIMFNLYVLYNYVSLLANYLLFVSFYYFLYNFPGD